MHMCKHCNKQFVNNGGLTTHEPYCKNNPDRIQRQKSPNAHRRKGSVAWNKGLITGHACKTRRPDEDVFVENSDYARHNLKTRIIKQKLIDYQCACCGIGPEWNGKPMPLILDHINGVHNDNRLENLRFVCSNCDSQLDTYKARNIRKKKNG